MAEQGCTQVSVVVKEDKRDMTGVLAVTASGTFLPHQLIYQGKINGFHSKLTFPTKWNVTHSAGHWSTAEKI